MNALVFVLHRKYTSHTTFLCDSYTECTHNTKSPVRPHFKLPVECCGWDLYNSWEDVLFPEIRKRHRRRAHVNSPGTCIITVFYVQCFLFTTVFIIGLLNELQPSQYDQILETFQTTELNITKYVLCKTYCIIREETAL